VQQQDRRTGRLTRPQLDHIQHGAGDLDRPSPDWKSAFDHHDTDLRSQQQ